MASQPLPAGHDGAGGLRYLSVCSGIEAATAAWHPLGWKAVAFSEIEAFPRAVLKHHYPEVPLHGDFTTIGADDYGAIDLLVGGTPCQSFSIAGLRGGLADDRGNLALEFLRLADRKRPRWMVWENVPGVLSSNEGRDFGSILGGMAELGYGLAYRVLDAQHFGVPQRRRRVFVVGYLGDWRRAAAVLFERHSLSGDTSPRRQARQVAPTVPSRSSAGGGLGTDFDCDGGLIDWPQQVAPTLNAAFGSKLSLENQHIDSGAGHFVAHSLRAEGFDASEDGTGRGTPLVPVAFGWQNSPSQGDGVGEIVATLDKSKTPAIAFAAKDHGADAMEDCSPTLRAGGHSKSHANAGVMPAVAFNAIAGTLKSCGGKSGTPNGAEEATRLVAHASAVRRLTPRECERLQGFPDTQRTAIITVCEGVKSDHAKSARRSSVAPRRGPSAPVAVSVLIDLEQERVALRNLDGSNWSASTAEPANSSPLSMPADAFARLAAHTLISLVPVTDAGAEGSLQNSKSSSPLWSGNVSVSAYGREIAALVSDAEKFTSEANRLSRFTTSPHGQDTQACEQTLETWSCCVCAAISGFIPEQIRNAPSYAISVKVRAGYTLIPWRGKPAGQCPDGPRYKALGNSMAVPCMAWVGQRIAAVEATPAAGNQLSQPPAVSARPDLGHNPSRNDAEGLGNSHVPHGRRDSPAREHDHA